MKDSYEVTQLTLWTKEVLDALEVLPAKRASDTQGIIDWKEKQVQQGGQSAYIQLSLPLQSAEMDKKHVLEPIDGSPYI